MQKLEVLIEENAFGSIRPVEVVADAPVGVLVPALVEELKLPQTDLFGKKLVYMLRYSADGHVLSDQMTLLASGVEPGARLALDSYVLENSYVSNGPPVNGPFPPMAPSPQIAVTPDPSLHSSVTISDESGFLPLSTRSAGGNVRNTGDDWQPFANKKRKWSRRALLVTGGVVLIVGGSGLGYAAYHAYTGGALNNVANTVNTVPVNTMRPTPAPTRALIPTKAQATFTFKMHKNAVRSVAWSPDGTLLASGADDQHVMIWTPNGVVQHDIPHPGGVQALAWSPDGQRLVTGAQKQVAFYNVQNAAVLATRMHANLVTSVAWATHGQMQVVSGGQDNRVMVWNNDNFQLQTTFQRHTTTVRSVSWSADGQTVASATQGGVIRVWQGNNGQELHGGYDINADARVLAFAPVGMQLAVGGGDGKVHIWNGLTCQQQANATIANQCIDAAQVLQASNAIVRSLAWSPDGRFLAVGTNDGKTAVWYPAQSLQKPIVTLPQQNNTAVHSVSWSPKGDQLVSAFGNTATIWSLM